jgi:hypothetical protein
LLSKIGQRLVLNLDYIELAPGFVREVLEIYEQWDGKETLPWKMKELIMVLQIEVNRLYRPGEFDRIAALPKQPEYRDTKLTEK